jgi:hypothetical protein
LRYLLLIKNFFTNALTQRLRFKVKLLYLLQRSAGPLAAPATVGVGF